VRRFGIFAAVAALCLGAACSGSSTSDGDGPSGTADAVVLGFVNMEGAASGSFPEAATGARAAVELVNDELGGVDGRPLRLETCTTNGTPESSRSCAQKLLAADPVAVVSGIDLGADASVPLVTGAGVPYVSGSPTLAGELTTAGAFAFTGGTAADLLGIGDHLIERQRVRSIHVLHEDLPGLLNAAISAAGDIFRAKDVRVKLVAEKADAADFAPTLTAAAGGDPDALIVVFPAQACARVLRAAQSLGITTPTYYVGACASEGVVRGGGDSLAHAFFASGFLPVFDEGGGEDGQAFRDGVPRAQRSPVSLAAFSAVLNVARLLQDGTPPEPESLLAALRATKDEPGALAHPYTCDGRQLPLLQAVCNSHVRLLQHRDGGFADALGAWVSGARLNELVR